MIDMLDLVAFVSELYQLSTFERTPAGMANFLAQEGKFRDATVKEVMSTRGLKTDVLSVCMDRVRVSPAMCAPGSSGLQFVSRVRAARANRKHEACCGR